jgi:hypothetical protein
MGNKKPGCLLSAYKKGPIPLRLRSQVAVRDGGLCQICGKKGRLLDIYFGLMAFERLPKGKSANMTGGSSIYPGWLSFEIDHIVNESKGGECTLENLQLACRPCNRSKR